MNKKYHLVIVLIAALLAAGCSHGNTGSPSSGSSSHNSGNTPPAPVTPVDPNTKEVSCNDLESVLSTLDPNQEYTLKITDTSPNLETIKTNINGYKINLD